jgi:hypothetical protein
MCSKFYFTTSNIFLVTTITCAQYYCWKQVLPLFIPNPQTDQGCYLGVFCSCSNLFAIPGPYQVGNGALLLVLLMVLSYRTASLGIHIKKPKHKNVMNLNCESQTYIHTLTFKQFINYFLCSQYPSLFLNQFYLNFL